MKKFAGVVVSVKMPKSAVVIVERIKVHPLYGKRVKSEKKYHVHDELNVKEGDKVVFAQAKPISKTKKWKIQEVINK